MLKLASVYLDDMKSDWAKEEAPTLHHMLIMVTKGTAVYTLNGKEMNVRSRELLFIPKGTIRSGRNSSSGSHQKYSAHFLIDEFSRFPLPDPHTYRKIAPNNVEYMKQRFSVMAQTWFSQMPYYETICTGIVIELLGYIARETDEDRFSSIKLRLMRQVQEYILEHYREPIHIPELAALVNRAPNYVTQTFKEVTGLSPISYVHQVRIQAARDLILNTRLSLGEIADYLGYSDQAHFNRMFRKLTGYAPSSMSKERE